MTPQAAVLAELQHRFLILVKGQLGGEGFRDTNRNW